MHQVFSIFCVSIVYHDFMVIIVLPVKGSVNDNEEYVFP